MKTVCWPGPIFSIHYIRCTSDRNSDDLLRKSHYKMNPLDIKQSLFVQVHTELLMEVFNSNVCRGESGRGGIRWRM